MGKFLKVMTANNLILLGDCNCRLSGKQVLPEEMLKPNVFAVIYSKDKTDFLNYVCDFKVALCIVRTVSLLRCNYLPLIREKWG